MQQGWVAYRRTGVAVEVDIAFVAIAQFASPVFVVGGDAIFVIFRDTMQNSWPGLEILVRLRQNITILAVHEYIGTPNKDGRRNIFF